MKNKSLSYQRMSLISLVNEILLRIIQCRLKTGRHPVAPFETKKLEMTFLDLPPVMKQARPRK